MKTIKEQHILDEVEKTLRAFDDDMTLEENPFLLTRIKALIGSRQHQTHQRSVLKAVLYPAVLALLLAINLLTLAHYRAWNTTQDRNEKLISAVKAEYQIDQTADNF